ncbi:RloB domain-containing protein (plasmid) [Peteryoungia desertarenae]|uniref:RloB domain-containing protein n=1 Tax=Peteryoungia desertarenae TaxID=1813451 RepID=A0ABX6QUI5_9HYPH|nr:RloB family protein [Peteryoungia desertarenae]QLF72072.1 RloB domain-containing protein [Peteryoungia desertarenae]
MAKHHRFERSESRLTRRKGRKRPYDRMLIVCEGAKTEVNYFEAIRRDRRLPNTDIAVVPSNYGTSPLQIVEYAIDRFNQTKGFERIYVVFDRDDHLTYHNALAKAQATDKALKNDAGSKVAFKAIPSVPNFELWLLLHFRDVMAPIHRNEVYAELRKPVSYPAYVKNSRTVFQDTKDLIPVATARAEAIRALFTPHSGTDPYTDVDLLTGELLKIDRSY